MNNAAGVIAASPLRRPPRTGRATVRGLLGNWPLVTGLLIVLVLLAMLLFGPLLAPEDPYLAGQRSVRIENGLVLSPPFPPGPGAPLGTDQWGRDILSTLLYGSRNTLIAALFIATARVLLGWALGAAAAWHEGTILDRTIMGAIELLSSLPLLLVGVIVILALDMRRGILVFMAALCLVGWGEIAQYVRAEFMVIRRKPFIEGARVIGLDGLGIAVRHVLPNVLPALCVLALLEMGSVLMALGELGFVGIFIGGGTAVEEAEGRVAAAIPDVPEWGAMMAGSRLWARSQPWMVFFPALAFFVAVLGFNLLGEGLRRLIQRGGVNTAFVFSRKMLLALAAIILSTAYIVTHVGPAPSYASFAQGFDQGQAMAHLQALAGEAMAGRGMGTAAADQAAEYIAARFREYGLQPLTQSEGYFQAVTVRVAQPVRQPELSLLAPDGSVAQAFAHREDFGEDITRHGGSGTAAAPLTFVDFTRPDAQQRDYKGLDLRGRVAVYVPAEAPPEFDVEALVRGAVGLLLVGDDVRPRLQLAYDDQDYLRPPTIPTFRITRATADRLLATEGLSLQGLAGSLRASPPATIWRATPLQAQVRLRLELSPVQEVTARSVVGVLPGSDVTLDEQLVVVSTGYDSLGPDPDGTIFPAASEGASGVAVILDTLRLWHEQGFTPRRTMLFAAWAGSGLERGGADRYAAWSRVSAYRPVAALCLGSLARGGETLAISDGTSPLSDLVRRSGEALGSDVAVSVGPWPPYLGAMGDRCPALAIGWEGAASVPARSDDLAGIDVGRLSRAGRIVNLALITLSREASW